MPKADCVHSTPPTKTAITSALKSLKRQAAAEIDRLIAFLDMVDGYTLSECEEAVDDIPCDGDDFEPSLGAFENLHHGDAWEVSPNAGCFVDAELNTCDDEAGGDDEPDLGWTRTGALGDSRDLEIGQATP